MSQDHHRSVTVDREGPGRFRVTNARGGSLCIGTGDDADFTPTELLLAAIGGCTAIDVDALTSRRADPEAFGIVTSARKVREASGNRLTDLETHVSATFPEGAAGDAARTILPDAVQRSHDRLCTVGRTVELGSPIRTHVSEG